MLTCSICSSNRTNKICNVKGFTVYECFNCSNAFTHPAPDITKYENEDFHNKTGDNTIMSVSHLPPDWQRLIRLQLSIIESSISLESRILEIGCGEGILLNELKKKGYNVTGIEPSVTAAKRGITKGLEIHCTYFEENTLSTKYDLIILSHVFEHIKGIGHFSNLLKQQLAKSGVLMLTQTNYKGLIPRIRKRNWYAWVPDQHFYHFTIKGLEYIFGDYNLEKQEYITLVHPKNWLYWFARFIPRLQDQFIITLRKSDKIRPV